MVQERCPRLILGGIAIAERHGRKANEHERLIAKAAQGCQFFVTQAIYDASTTKSLLSDYALRLKVDGHSPVPIILTFAPCGSSKTLELMKWLGISFPRWLENELKHSTDVLERSIRLCEQLFADIWDYAQEKKLPLGINVESVSIRKAEVDASVELFRLLRARIDAATRP
jgi:5,10-methylenetetrahydrofolate reductase